MKTKPDPRTVCLVTLLTLSAGSALIARPATAQAPAVGFTANAYGIEDNAADVQGSATGSYSLGFEFTANSAALVTSLGFFSDPSFDPANPFNTVALSPTPAGTRAFASSHDVGLYQIVGGISTLRASATVTSSGARIGDFLYESLTTPFLLVAGGDYVLAGVTGPTDPYVFNIEDDTQPGAVGLTTNGITYVQDRFDVSSSLVLPTQTDPGFTPGFFGPNFLAAPIPEASTTVSLGLLLLGFAGMAARRRPSH